MDQKERSKTFFHRQCIVYIKIPNKSAKKFLDYAS